jgi:superfamily I DNA/RNA helicase
MCAAVHRSSKSIIARRTKSARRQIGFFQASYGDIDGVEEHRGGTVSVFNGPEPVVSRHPTAEAEIAAVSNFIRQSVADGILPLEIGVFVRSRGELDRARAAVKLAGLGLFELSGEGDNEIGGVSIGTMHLAKGLEFKAVIVMACDHDVLPLQSRIESVADEVKLDDVYETERQLLYVACTRARDRLMVSCVSPGSEFVADLGPGPQDRPSEGEVISSSKGGATRFLPFFVDSSPPPVDRLMSARL